MENYIVVPDQEVEGTFILYEKKVDANQVETTQLVSKFTLQDADSLVKSHEEEAAKWRSIIGLAKQTR